MRLALAALLVFVSGAAHGEEQTLRIGTIVPEGTGWARSLRALAEGVEAATGGAVHLKVYMGGVAGDEMEMLARVRRGQLDGVLSGGMACETIAPSLRVVRIPGVLQSWPETSYALGRLRPIFDEEAKRNGFTYLGEAIVGPSILFTRTPVRDIAVLKRQHLWVWDIDKMLRLILPEMGIPVVPLPIREALQAYEQSRLDGVVTPAVVALAFQWSTAMRYYTDLRLGFVVGCFLVANRAFDALPASSQQALRIESAKTKQRFEQTGRMQEEQLLGGLFQKQGLTPMNVDAGARASFFDAARAARERVAGQLVSQELITRVLGMLADFRSTHWSSDRR
jgi:TRAP-type C4-dicarboxylate transport system substrate-binding protein